MPYFCKYKTKDQIKKFLLRICCILCGIIVVSCIIYAVVFGGGLKNTENRIDISYTDITSEIAINDNYMAYWEENKIIVKKRDGTNVITFNPNQEEMAPDQIVLGEEGCYFMEWEYMGTETLWGAEIVQLSYISGEKKKIKIKNAACMTCKDGNLFIGKWMEESQPKYLNGFYANYYVEEKNFGNDNVVELSSDNDGEVRVGKTILYYHTEDYFCTEPETDGYQGTFTLKFKTQNRYKRWKKISNKREYKDFSLLLESLDWNKGDMCQLTEYQDGNDIFGVLNFYKGKKEGGRSFSLADIKEAVFYRIDCSENTLKIVKQSRDICAVLSTEKYNLYVTKTGLFKEDTISGKMENLLNFDQLDDLEIKIQKNVFQVLSCDEQWGGEWDQNDCKLCL